MSDMTVISENDLIESVADALQYISYYHPMDYIRALGQAYDFKAFNDAVVLGGNVPMDVLEKNVGRYIAAARS